MLPQCRASVVDNGPTLKCIGSMFIFAEVPDTQTANKHFSSEGKETTLVSNSTTFKFVILFFSVFVCFSLSCVVMIIVLFLTRTGYIYTF